MFATFHKSPMSMFCFGMGGKTFVKTLSVLVCRLLEHLLCGCTHIQLYLSGTFVTQVYLSGPFVRQVCTTMCVAYKKNFMNDLMSS